VSQLGNASGASPSRSSSVALEEHIAAAAAAGPLTEDPEAEGAVAAESQPAGPHEPVHQGQAGGQVVGSLAPRREVAPGGADDSQHDAYASARSRLPPDSPDD
jgi:hypothetical protein